MLNYENNIIQQDRIVCESVFNEFSRLFPGLKLKNYNIHIKLRNCDSPKCCPKRLNPSFDIDFLIYLNFDELFWSQIVFQLAHELSHLVMNCYPDEHQFKWISECLCGAASFYLLSLSDIIFEQVPTYIPKAKRYLKEMLDEIPTKSKEELKTYINENLQDLKEDPCNIIDNQTNYRPRNDVISKYWYNLISENVDGWEAIRHFSNPYVYGSQELYSFFSNWNNICANERQKQFVNAIRESVELEITA